MCPEYTESERRFTEALALHQRRRRREWSGNQILAVDSAEEREGRELLGAIRVDLPSNMHNSFSIYLLADSGIVVVEQGERISTRWLRGTTAASFASSNERVTFAIPTLPNGDSLSPRVAQYVPRPGA